MFLINSWITRLTHCQNQNQKPNDLAPPALFICLEKYRAFKKKNPLKTGIHEPLCAVYSVTQSWLILCDFMDWNPPSSSVCGIFQARILERVAISYSRGPSQLRDRTHNFCISCNSGQILHHCTTWEAHSWTSVANEKVSVRSQILESQPWISL